MGTDINILSVWIRVIPLLNGCLGRSFQNGGHSLDFAIANGPNGNSLLDDIDKRRCIHRFHQDLIGLQQDGLGGSLHLVEMHSTAASQQRIGMAHRADDGEPVPCLRHMQIPHQHVVGL